MGAPTPSADATTADRPAHGAKCPRCGNGLLYAIGENDDGVLLRCFNCDTQGTVPRTGEWQPSVDPATTSPTGFQVTHEQLAAQRAVSDPEQAADRARRADQAAGEQQAQLADRDARITELQRQLDEARAGTQQPPPPEGQG